MEKTLLIKLFNQKNEQEINSDIEEMKGLIMTAGAEIVDIILQQRSELSPAYYIGKGKALEIAKDYKDKCDLAIFDADLKPVQVRNLERLLNMRVIDRTQLILDIFASRAQTREGKLQVEYAQLTYMLPRLAGKGVELSRVGGSAGGGKSPIGTKGPGETKLETDKRKIRRKLTKIKEDLKRVKTKRSQQRERRQSVPVPLIAIVGYTNVGKTMFLNKMTSSNKLSENKLFATLDSKIRHYILPNRYKVLFSDTVGFIKNLPTSLVAAFRGTLEEVQQADVILHFMDASDPDCEKHKEIVYGILKDISAFEDKEIIEVYNKVDLIDEEEKKFLLPGRKKIYVSAKTGEGIDVLIETIEKSIESDFMEQDVEVPMEKAGALTIFYDEGIVVDREDKEKHICVKVRGMKKTFDKYYKIIQED